MMQIVVNNETWIFEQDNGNRIQIETRGGRIDVSRAQAQEIANALQYILSRALRSAD